MSPTEVWENIKIETENFDETILKEYETEEATYKEMYFNGKKTEKGVTRIYAVLACPKTALNPSVVLLCHDFNSTIGKSYIEYFLKMNFAVLMCDMYGKFEGRKYTFYPDDIKYANGENWSKFNLEVTTTARETMPFEWVMVNRYAIQYLKTQENIDSSKIACIGIGEGATITWQLAFVEKELKTCIALFYAGWGEYGKNYKFSQNRDISNLNFNQAAYIAGISPQSYAPYVNVPMLYLTASNSQIGNLDRAFDTMARINGAITSLMTVTANSMNRLGFLATRNLRLWLDKYLSDADLEIPEKPEIKFENFAGKLLSKCITEDDDKVRKVKLFYAEGSTTPAARCWFERELAKSGDGFVGGVDLTDSTETLFAFANVEYKNGFSVCSNFVTIEPKSYGIEKKLIKENIIYNGLMGIDTFVGMKGLISMGASDTFSDKHSVKLIEGANGIEGITSTDNLATFKLSKNSFAGESGDYLVLDVWSIEAQIINVIVFCNLGEDGETVYSTELKAVGADAWQNFKLACNDFKDSNKSALENWSEIKLIMFKGKTTWALNNFLWI